MTAAPPAPAPAKWIAPVALVVAIATCALVLWVGPPVADAVIGLFGDPANVAAGLMDSIFTFVIFGVLLAVALVGARLCRVNPLQLGARPLSGIMLGAGLGAGGVVIAAFYCRLAGTLVGGPAGPRGVALLWGLVLVLLQSGSEEVYFRGWLQPVLARSWGPVAAIGVAAAAFAFLHILGGSRSPLTVVNLFLGGTLFGLLAFYRGGIAAAVAAHFAWNWTEQAILGLFPNPGVDTFGAMTNLELVGAARWGGSEEGLNASLAMTVVLVAWVVALVLMWPSRRTDGLNTPSLPEPNRSGPARV